MQLDELMNPEAGYLVKEGLVLCVEVLECCPWFEFADLEKYTSDEDAASTVSREDDGSASCSEESACSSTTAESAESFWAMMGRSGLGLGCAASHVGKHHPSKVAEIADLLAQSVCTACMERIPQ